MQAIYNDSTDMYYFKLEFHIGVNSETNSGFLCGLFFFSFSSNTIELLRTSISSSTLCQSWRVFKSFSVLISSDAIDTTHKICNNYSSIQFRSQIYSETLFPKTKFQSERKKKRQETYTKNISVLFLFCFLVLPCRDT